jgi:putative resolvase
MALGLRLLTVRSLKDAYQELVEDLIALVSSFAGKLYGLGSHKYEKVVEGVKQLITE